MQDNVGLRTRRQCEAIVRFLHSWQAKQADQSVTLCVEGNISAGKSTFLNLMKKTMVGQLQQVIEVRGCSYWGCWPGPGSGSSCSRMQCQLCEASLHSVFSRVPAAWTVLSTAATLGFRAKQQQSGAAAAMICHLEQK